MDRASEGAVGGVAGGKVASTKEFFFVRASRVTTAFALMFSPVGLFAPAHAQGQPSARQKSAPQSRQQLEGQRRAQRGYARRNIIVAVTVFPKVQKQIGPGIEQQIGFTIYAEGRCEPFYLGPGRGEGFGTYKLPPKTMRKLDALLSKLPALQQPNSTTRFIITFFRRHKWKTRIYDGTVGRGTLQALLKIPGQNEQGYPDIFGGYNIGDPIFSDGE